MLDHTVVFAVGKTVHMIYLDDFGPRTKRHHRKLVHRTYRKEWLGD